MAANGTNPLILWPSRSLKRHTVVMNQATGLPHDPCWVSLGPKVKIWGEDAEAMR